MAEMLGGVEEACFSPLRVHRVAGIHSFQNARYASFFSHIFAAMDVDTLMEKCILA